MTEHTFTVILKKARTNATVPTTPFVENLSTLLHHNLERALEAKKDLALAHYLQDAIFHVTFSMNKNDRPSTDDDKAIHQELIKEYKTLIDRLVKEATQPSPILVLHLYFIQELDHLENTHSLKIREQKLAYTKFLQELILIREDETLPAPSSSQEAGHRDWNLEKYRTFIKSKRLSETTRYGACTALSIHELLPNQSFSNKMIDQHIDDIVYRHQLACDEADFREGTFKVLAQQIKEGTLQHNKIPVVSETISILSPPKGDYFESRIKSTNNLFKKQWIKELKNEIDFSRWNGEASVSARSYAFELACKSMLIAVICTVVISLIVARFTVGPIHWSNPDWASLKKAHDWFTNSLGAYILANTATPATVAMVSYKYRKQEFIFKQNEILSFPTKNNNLAL